MCASVAQMLRLAKKESEVISERQPGAPLSHWARRVGACTVKRGTLGSNSAHSPEELNVPPLELLPIGMAATQARRVTHRATESDQLRCAPAQ
jgi:hypothetical protein